MPDVWDLPVGIADRVTCVGEQSNVGLDQRALWLDGQENLRWVNLSYIIPFRMFNLTPDVPVISAAMEGMRAGRCGSRAATSASAKCLTEIRALICVGGIMGH